MGKAADTSAAPAERLNRGKRAAEDAVDKEAVLYKKQKAEEPEIGVKAEEVVKNVVESSSEEESSSEPERPKTKVEPTKDGNLPKKAEAAAKNGPVASLKKDASSGDSDDETSADDKAVKIKAAVAKTNESGEMEPTSVAQKKDLTFDDLKSSEGTILDEVAPGGKNLATIDASRHSVPAKKEEGTISGSADSHDDLVYDKNDQKKALSSNKDESYEELDSDDQSLNAVSLNKRVADSSEVVEASSSDDTYDDSSDEREDEEPQIIETNSEQPISEVTSRDQASKTVYVGNLDFSVEQDDVENFFQAAGEIVEIRFAIRPEGTFKGFGHVEFASPEAAEKAVRELNGKYLLGRAVRLDLARERGSYTPHSRGRDTPLFQKEGRASGQTVFIRGFNKNAGEDEVRNSLEKFFGVCGEISKISLPTAQDGGLKGIAYIDFKDAGALTQALGLNGSEFGNGTLTVEEPRRSGSGRWDFGGRFGGGGWFVGGRRLGGFGGGRHLGGFGGGGRLGWFGGGRHHGGFGGGGRLGWFGGGFRRR